MMNARARCSVLAVPLLAALGCSDPVPLPAQGAISLSVQKPSTSINGSNCPDSGTTYQVGAPGVPTQQSFGDSLIDGDQGSHISCSVKGSGTTFAFSGSFQATTSVGDPLPITVTFSNGTITDGKGTAAVSVFTPKLAGTFASAAGSDCTIQVIGGQIANGHVWATFSCAGITAPPSGLCAVGTSVIVFENCDGS